MYLKNTVAVQCGVTLTMLAIIPAGMGACLLHLCIYLPCGNTSVDPVIVGHTKTHWNVRKPLQTFIRIPVIGTASHLISGQVIYSKIGHSSSAMCFPQGLSILTIHLVDYFWAFPLIVRFQMTFEISRNGIFCCCSPSVCAIYTNAKITMTVQA